MKADSKNTEKETQKARQIVGFSLPPELASAVKIEAARRGLSLRKLFSEMWESYTARQAPPRSRRG